MNGTTSKFVGFQDVYDYGAGAKCAASFLDDRVTHNKGTGWRQGIIYALRVGPEKRAYYAYQTKTLLVVQRLPDTDA